MKKIIIYVSSKFFSVSLIVSCGGGGGGSAPTTNLETIFPLMVPGADVSGYQITGNLTGTVTLDGTPYNASGTFSQQARPIVFLNAYGVNTVPVDTLLNINTPQLVPSNLSILSTTYFNSDSG